MCSILSRDILEHFDSFCDPIVSICTVFPHTISNLKQLNIILYRGSPDSTNFGPPGDRTIAKIVLSGD